MFMYLSIDYGKTVRGFITANDTPNKDFTVKSYSNVHTYTCVHVHVQPVLYCYIYP